MTYCSFPFRDVGDFGPGTEERVGCDHNFCFQCFPEEICTVGYFRETPGALACPVVPGWLGRRFPFYFPVVPTPNLLLWSGQEHKTVVFLALAPNFSSSRQMPPRLSHESQESLALLVLIPPFSKRFFLGTVFYTVWCRIVSNLYCLVQYSEFVCTVCSL